MNIAYWGPPAAIGHAAARLSVNVGPETNVESDQLHVQRAGADGRERHGAGPAHQRAGPGDDLPQHEMPPLAAMPACLQPANVRTSLLENGGSGLNVTQAYARAQGITDKSVDDVVTAQGELDALRYGGVLPGRAAWSACAAPASPTTASTT